MNDNLFDKHLQDKLANYNSQVPNGMWEKIVKDKRRNPVVIWWTNRLSFVFGLIFISATIGALLFWQKNTSQDEKLLLEKQSAENLQTDNKISIDNKEKQNIEASKLITENVILEKENLNTKQENTVSVKNAEATIKNVTITYNNNIRKINNEYAYKRNNVNTKKGTKLSTNSNDITNNFLDNNSFSLYTSKPAKAEGISLKSNLLLNNNIKNAPLLNANFFKPKDCPSIDGNRRNDWYYEVYASPDYVIKSVKGNDANSAYLQKKDSSESMRGGFTVGGRISKNINEQFVLKAGLQFTQLNERLSVRTENERRVITVVTIKTVTDASGNTTTVSDTSTVIQIGYVEKVANNYYRNLELPITLGYEFGNKKFKASINGGVIVNLSSWYSGKVLDTAYRIVPVNPKGTDGVYKHNIGLSLYGSISLIKPMSDRIDVFAEPYFRYNLSSIKSNAYGFSQRFGAVGVSLGVRYKLNGKGQRL